MLTGPGLRAAARGDWNTVFWLLYHQLMDVNARHVEHPQGFRLLDYSEEQRRGDLSFLLLRLGATPSWDIKVFRAAQNANWEQVLEIVATKLFNPNQPNDLHPAQWTLMDYAISQKNGAMMLKLAYLGAKYPEKTPLFSPIPVRAADEELEKLLKRDEDASLTPYLHLQKENSPSLAQITAQKAAEYVLQEGAPSSALRQKNI